MSRAIIASHCLSVSAVQTLRDAIPTEREREPNICLETAIDEKFLENFKFHPTKIC